MSLENLPPQKEKHTAPKKERITLHAINELENPIKKILIGIRPQIEKGEYRLIIGDDASGRIPTLILGDTIQRISKIKEISGPNIIFIPGKLKVPSGNEAGALYDFITKQNVRSGDKVLICTEAVRTGHSLSILTHFLHDMNINVEIAAIGLEEQNKYFDKYREENLGKAKIISGEYANNRSHTPQIYMNSRISGVKKESYEFGSSKILHIRERDSIVKARKESKILSNKLTNWYLSKTK